MFLKGVVGGCLEGCGRRLFGGVLWVVVWKGVVGGCLKDVVGGCLEGCGGWLLEGCCGKVVWRVLWVVA